MSEERVRAFIAVELPREIRSALAYLIRALQRDRLAGVRWVNPEGVHLTLKFLGGVPSELIPDLVAVLRRVATTSQPFQLHLGPVGSFPNLRRPRVLWVGLEGDLAPLTRLQRELEQEVASLGFPREGRPFSPHLTLGRLRDTAGPQDRRRAGEAISHMGVESRAVMRVEAVSLMRSDLRPGGAVYHRLAEAPLGQPSPRG